MKISDLKDYTVVSSAEAKPVEQPQQKSGLGSKIMGAAEGVSNFFGGKGVAEFAGGLGAKAILPKEQRKYVEMPSAKEVAGSALQLGSLAIPAAGVGANLATKVGVGAATGYAMDVGSKLQQKDKTIPQAMTPGVGTAVGGGLPIAGAVIKPAVAIVGRLFKGLGSGLSGVPTKTIDSIVNNPHIAMEASKRLAKSGNNKVLEDNARQIVNGVSRIRQEARKGFGEGLDQLAQTDIEPAVFRSQTQALLDKYGFSTQGGKKLLSNIEFSEPKNIQKATDLIKRLNTVDLDGKALRKLADDIESSAYKVATSDERLSFNAFIKDLAGSLKNAISQSTPKLDEINQKFSQDMQLAEAIEGIFGKVNFKNLPEVIKASQKLEGLFTQKGLAPQVVDDFLKRIDIDAGSFRTGEAIRQIAGKETGANTKGLSIGEITQQVTSAVVTPQMIKNLSIATGMTKESLLPFLRKMKPAARNILINALLQGQVDSK